METNFIEWIVGASGTAGVAALALWMLNETWKQRLADAGRYAETLDKHRIALVDVVQANIHANESVAAASRQQSEALAEVMERLCAIHDAVAPRSKKVTK
jgi:hypothetical protein